jgi:hypothetical protein
MASRPRFLRRFHWVRGAIAAARASHLTCILLLAGSVHGLDPQKYVTQYLHTSWRIQDGSVPRGMGSITQEIGTLSIPAAVDHWDRERDGWLCGDRAPRADYDRQYPVGGCVSRGVGIGTVVGMMLITLTMGSTFAYGGKRIAMLGKHFASAAGAISVTFGLFNAYQIGFVDGLFRAQAHWIPR